MIDLNALRRMAGINTVGPKTISAGNTQANQMRKLAGLPMLPEAKGDVPPPEEIGNEEETELPPQDPTSVKSETPEEEDQPAIINKIAKHLEGKSVEEIHEMLMQVYEAGKSDAKAEMEAGEEKPAESAEDESGLEPGEEAEVKEAVDAQWKKDRLKGCKCPSEKTVSNFCPIHGVAK